jgi:hypothetical protein
MRCEGTPAGLTLRWCFACRAPLPGAMIVIAVTQARCAGRTI